MIACALGFVWMLIVIADGLLGGAAFCIGRAWESVSRVQRCGCPHECGEVRC